MNKITVFLFLNIIFVFNSCKSIELTSKEEITLSKEEFHGIYSAEFDTHYMGLDSYAVEFNEDKTARVIMFKIGDKKPYLIIGKWLLNKDNLIVLYFSNSLTSEYFKNNNNGTICIVDKNKNNSAYLLRKIYK